MRGKTLDSWTTDSALAHAVEAAPPAKFDSKSNKHKYKYNHKTSSSAGSSSPLGPFNLSDIVLSPRSPSLPEWDSGSLHGTYIIRNPKPYTNSSDAWLLFYTGMPSVGEPLSQRKIGVAIASSLHGPWTPHTTPVFEAATTATTATTGTGSGHHIDNSSVSNPTPAFFNDGR